MRSRVSAGLIASVGSSVFFSAFFGEYGFTITGGVAETTNVIYLYFGGIDGTGWSGELHPAFDLDGDETTFVCLDGQMPREETEKLILEATRN